MLARYAIAGVAGSALLASIAFAQTPTATGDRADTPPAAASSTATSLQGDWRASKLAGLSVYNDDNESLGSINDLLMDKSGTVKAVVIGVGGFLGVGEHLVTVSFDKLKFVNEPVAYTGAAGAPNPGIPKSASTTTSTTTTGAANGSASSSTTKSNPWYPDHAVLNATKEELKAMPEFRYSTQ
jgi:sporulation protein YlmC with PRC-barrel domain